MLSNFPVLQKVTFSSIHSIAFDYFNQGQLVFVNTFERCFYNKDLCT